VNGHETRPEDLLNDQLRNAITRADFEGVTRVSVEQCDADLTSIPGVDRSRTVEDGDAVPGGKPTPRHDEGAESIGKRDRHTGPDGGAFSRPDHHVVN